MGRHRLFSLRELREAVAMERDLKESVNRAGTDEERHRAELRVVVLAKAIRACRPESIDASVESGKGGAETNVFGPISDALPLRAINEQGVGSCAGLKHGTNTEPAGPSTR